MPEFALFYLMIIVLVIGIKIIFGESESRIDKLKKVLKDADTEELEMVKSIIEKELNKR